MARILTNYYRVWVGCMFVVLLVSNCLALISFAAMTPQATYPNTISALQKRYIDEVTARDKLHRKESNL